MKKIILVSLAAFAMTFAACGTRSNASESKKIDSSGISETVSEQNSNNSEVLKSPDGRPMLADFSAEWCPPCRQMKPVFQKLQAEYEGKIDLVTIDVDNNPELAERYNVTSIPTLVYISPTGKELHRTVGLQTEAIICADIIKYLSE